MKLFISYAHENKKWMYCLKPFLDGFSSDERMTRKGTGLDYLHAWHDSELTAGNEWDGEIKKELAEMDIFVPLVTPNFFSSWYIQNVELPEAVNRHNRGEIKVVPILVYNTNLREKCSFLHGFKTFPASDKWWSSYRDRNDAYRLIDDGLWDAIDDVLKSSVKKR